jgi:hypothetical protein
MMLQERERERERSSERKDFEEGRKVRMQMTFIYSTVTLNPWVTQEPKVKFGTQRALCEGSAGGISRRERKEEISQI